MNNDNRIVELLTDMLHEQRKTNEILEKFGERQTKTNDSLGEMRLSFMKLANEIDILFDHEKRIVHLEETVFHS